MAQPEHSTLERILRAAREEFLEKGYPHAFLRDIAARAGVTTGAFYGYFRTKAEVFDALVQEPYHCFLEMYRRTLEAFQALPPEEQLKQMPARTLQAAREMVDYMYDHREAFRLILCCSQGTAYAGLTEELARLDRNATHSFVRTSASLGCVLRPVHPLLEHVLISGMFTSFSELIVHEVPRDQAAAFTEQLLDFYSAGWMQLLGL